MRGGVTGDRDGYLSSSLIGHCLYVNEFISVHPDMGRGGVYAEIHAGCFLVDQKLIRLDWLPF